jgi:endonuclease III
MPVPARGPDTIWEEEDLTPAERLAAQDRSSWPPHPSERRDFYHRIRAFPSEVAAWRRRLLAEIADIRKRFPLATFAAPEQLQEQLDAGISHLREIARILAVLHGTPDLGNKKDPTENEKGDCPSVAQGTAPFFATALARHTREGAYQQAFDALKKRFRRWDDLLDAPAREVRKLVYSGGLSSKKTLALRAALRALRKRFGSCTLKPARSWSDEELESFLRGLPELERKSAYCVMMYSFGRQVFPADTHVGRVLARLGPYRELGLSLEGYDQEQLQRTVSLLPSLS